MKIIVTGGGTAGHVTPLLAVVSEIVSQNPSAQIRYIGQFGDKFLNKMVASDQNISKQSHILAGKLRRFHGRGMGWYLSHPSLILRNIRDVFYIIIGICQSLFILIFWRPDVVFVKGGYVCLPVGIASGLLRIPIVTHDSDSIPGLTNRVISRFASNMAVAMPASTYAKFYPLKKVVETGLPVRSDFFQDANKGSYTVARAKLGIHTNTKLVVIVGGSLGAVRLNNAIMHNLNGLLADNIMVYWATGAHQYSEILAKVNSLKNKKQVVVKPFFDNLSQVFTASDLVVSRSGATTLAELAILKKPTILVPNPVLSGGHQTINAKVFERKKACVVISENSIENDPKLLCNTINDIINDTKQLATLANNISLFAHPEAAKNLAKLIIDTGGRL